jgi:hypothetical protein
MQPVEGFTRKSNASCATQTASPFDLRPKVQGQVQKIQQIPTDEGKNGIKRG